MVGLGIPGALIAVPLLATFKIVCDHIAMSLISAGEFLGGREPAARRPWLGGRGTRSVNAILESSSVHA